MKCPSFIIGRLAPLLLVVSSVPASAQLLGEPTDTWFTQAQTITDNLRKDAITLSRFDRGAVVPVTLQKNGTFLHKWSGTDKYPTVRQKMASQIVSDKLKEESLNRAAR